jgi:glycosyltransferase involved in cell wall biosynthesis
VPHSLSVVLPVANAQATLTSTVSDVLDVIPDLTDDFEILIVDDASTDLTEEIAIELAQTYPQVTVSRNRRSMGSKDSVRAGLSRCTGDVIFVKDDASPVRASDLRSMWQMRSDEQLVMAKSPAHSHSRSADAPATPDQVDPQPLSPELIRRLMQWGAALETANDQSHGGIQMIRRQAVEQLDSEYVAVETPPEPVAQDDSNINRRTGSRPVDRNSRSEQISRRMPPRPYAARS